jgi:hypothetical protein
MIFIVPLVPKEDASKKGGEYCTWTHLTTDQRERRLNQLLIFKQRNNDDVTSSDDSLTVPLVARVASKPGQRKRPLNAKTTTITTKKLKVTGLSEV